MRRCAAEHGVVRQGAAEHGVSQAAMEWTGAVGIANVGLSGEATSGKSWYKTHRPKLLNMFVGMLAESGVCGLCLCEMGNLDYPLTKERRELVKNSSKGTRASRALCKVPKTVCWHTPV